MRKPTVFIIDDDPSARRGLTRLVAAAGLDVESFASAQDFLAAGQQSDPGCIVVDVKMPAMTGPELQEELRNVDNRLPIIFISAHGDVQTVARTMKGGAVDFLAKPVDGENLLAVIAEALVTDTDRRILRAEIETFVDLLTTLTSREHEVLTHVIAGKPNRQIAFELDISETTVKIHRGRVMRKLKINSLPELVRICEKADITPAI